MLSRQFKADTVQNRQFFALNTYFTCRQQKKVSEKNYLAYQQVLSSFKNVYLRHFFLLLIQLIGQNTIQNYRVFFFS